MARVEGEMREHLAVRETQVVEVANQLEAARKVRVVVHEDLAVAVVEKGEEAIKLILS